LILHECVKEIILAESEMQHNFGWTAQQKGLLHTWLCLNFIFIKHSIRRS